VKRAIPEGWNALPKKRQSPSPPPKKPPTPKRNVMTGLIKELWNSYLTKRKNDFTQRYLLHNGNFVRGGKFFIPKGCGARGGEVEKERNLIGFGSRQDARWGGGENGLQGVSHQKVGRSGWEECRKFSTVPERRLYGRLGMNGKEEDDCR